jgi:hypothetical protein
MWMVEDEEWWFNVWIVRRNEKKKEKMLMAEDAWWFTLRLQEGIRRRKMIVDCRGCRVVVHLVDCEKD